MKLEEGMNLRVLAGCSIHGVWEEKIAFEISEKSNAKVLPKMNLDNLKATISNADLVIGNDTGPTYIGWANNIPTILLYGTTPVSRMFENKTTKIIKSKTAKYFIKIVSYLFIVE